MSKKFQYTFAGNDKIGDRSDVRSFEMKNQEKIAYRERMIKLEIFYAQAKIDFASRQCEKFKKERDDIQKGSIIGRNSCKTQRYPWYPSQTDMRHNAARNI